MNRLDLLRQDIVGIQAFLGEFGECPSGEPRSVGLGRTDELLLLRNFPLPDGFRPDHIDLLLVIADYPGRPPIGAYVLNRNNATLLRRLEGIFHMYRDRAFYQAPAIPGYTWICYHYAGDVWHFNAAHPAAGDNLRKFLMSFFSICERD
ncbi:MAG: hypothetical protein ACREU7_13250 [Burkholderiales bacterium]